MSLHESQGLRAMSKFQLFDHDCSREISNTPIKAYEWKASKEKYGNILRYMNEYVQSDKLENLICLSYTVIPDE